MPSMKHDDRRVQPVPSEYDPDEIFDPASHARPGLAAWMLLGPLLATIGLLGWLRLTLTPPPLQTEPWEVSVLLHDGFFLMLFILSHSLLARGFGRRFLNRLGGPAGERPLYVFISGATLTACVLAWKSTGQYVWNHEGGLLLIGRLLQACGLLLTTWAVLVAGGAHMLGLPHLRALETGRRAPPRELVALPPYRWMRQPISAGVLLLLAGTPTATPDRLLFIALTALWILLAAPFEERDAELTFGRAYSDYHKRTPRWIPRKKKSNSP